MIGSGTPAHRQAGRLNEKLSMRAAENDLETGSGHQDQFVADGLYTRRLVPCLGPARMPLQLLIVDITKPGKALTTRGE